MHKQQKEEKNIFTGNLAVITFPLAIILALTHLFLGLFPLLSELSRNALHFAGFALLCTLAGPGTKKYHHQYLNLLIGCAIAISALHLALGEDAIYDRGVKLAKIDWIAAIITIAGAIELSRRVAGLIVPILILLSLSYIAFWGQHISGIFRFGGLSLETILFRSIYGDDAIFGTIARISSTYVYLFILFGAFLLRSGGGDFIVDLARAVAGKLIGGPGFVAVIASALTGTISGSAVANTASTGVITIPLMKRTGFSARFSAGVEAAASTGGQLMPPIMGSGAFIMASYTQTAYEKIVAAAFLPAILYFISVAFFIRIEAKRLNLSKQSDPQKNIIHALKQGGAPFFIPLFVLITLLMTGHTPVIAAIAGIGAVILASWFGHKPMGIQAICEALALGSRNMIMTAILLCSVGLITNVIATAGIGNVFSLMIVDWSNGNLFLAIILVALASLILGMGLPVTAAYIVLATLSAPALAGMIQDGFLVAMLVKGTIPPEAVTILTLAQPELAAFVARPMEYQQALAMIRAMPLEFLFLIREQAISPEAAGAALLTAHMIIFWLSQDSNVTPPVCLASFTAAAIAKSPPMATGLTSWKIAKGLYLVPLLFAYTPLLSGDWGAALAVFFPAIIGMYALVAALQGWMEQKLTPLERLLAAISGGLCLWPGIWPVNLVACAIVLLLIFRSYLWKIYSDH